MRRLRARIAAAYRWAVLRRCQVLGDDVRVVGRVWIYGGGRVRIGDRVVLDGGRGPIELHAARGAELAIGDDVRIDGGVSIEAVESVVIEARSTIGAWSKVLDNQFHTMSGNRTSRPSSEAVRIGPDVQLGERCVVLPGARLERGVRLGHGVVIGRYVPGGVALEGNPPQRVRERGSR